MLVVPQVSYVEPGHMCFWHELNMGDSTCLEKPRLTNHGAASEQSFPAARAGC